MIALVPAAKAADNNVWLFEDPFINFILEELGYNSISDNPTYTYSSF